MSATGRVGRYNVGAAHSPELLRELASPLAGTGEPSGTVTRGVDVAAAQHPGGAGIDWPQVAAAGYSFAAVKATEGTYYANPWYGADAAGAAAAGLQVTGYHVAIPNVSGGAAQADYAVRHLGQAAGGQAADGRSRPLELDVEYDPYTATDHTNQCYGLAPARLVAWIGAFIREAERVGGQAPVIYTSAAWWRACTGDSAAFSADPLWVRLRNSRDGGVGVLVLPAVHQRWHRARDRGQWRDRRQLRRPEPDGRGHPRRGGWGGRGFWGDWGDWAFWGDWWGCCGVRGTGGSGGSGGLGGSGVPGSSRGSGASGVRTAAPGPAASPVASAPESLVVPAATPPAAGSPSPVSPSGS